jgi:hypothetical protein
MSCCSSELAPRRVHSGPVRSYTSMHGVASELAPRGPRVLCMVVCVFAASELAPRGPGVL